ncbi:MAG: acetoacetate--CoA ligase [Pseudomonadales bacterium]
MSILWQPDQRSVEQLQITEFQRQIESRFDQSFANYAEFHRWSINHSELFWPAVWDYCEVIGNQGETTLAPDNNPTGAQWFPGAELNFAENLLRYNDDRLAMIGLLENGQRQTWTYQQLHASVATLAKAMKAEGIQSGDRVAGLLPNIPQTIIAMLATTSLGAIWSSCSPDFGVGGATDRFAQIEPKLLFTTDGYFYNGKTIELEEKYNAIHANISSIQKVVVIPLLKEASALPPNCVSFADFTSEHSADEIDFVRLPFNHPAYILYSSGTTGIPKCIVHGAGGTLLQHLKEHRLHVDLKREDRFFYFTTCGWMMWNWLVSGLASGCTLVLYDGSPFAKRGKVLLNAIDEEQISVFGTSAKYISSLEKTGRQPAKTHSLESLRTILSTGSPLGHSAFEYIYRDFKADVHLASISGGTDIVSCFILGNPALPVRTGELQCAGLGMAVAFYNGDEPAAVGEQGELVCSKPFPSAPVGFWNDPDDAKFNAAYFAERPGIWTHGDYGEVTRTGGYIIHGRSDATLNPSGVRIGTAEIYRQVDAIPEVIEGIVVGQNWQGDERVVLFVVLQNGLSLTEDLAEKIKQTIKTNTTPRHVPARIIQVKDIPRTMSGKIVELAVRDTIHGKQVANTASLANPEALKYFQNLPELNT